MKFSIRLTALLLVVALLAGGAAASGGAKISVGLRIEGIKEYLYYNTAIELAAGASVEDLLRAVNGMEGAPKITFTGSARGTYVSKIDELAEFDYGGFSGWQYVQNGAAVSTGIANTKLGDGDSIVFYYSDQYGDAGFQIPIIDVSSLINSGIIRFKSNDTTYDETESPTTAVKPIIGATVTFNGARYTTDAKGEILIKDKSGISGFRDLQIEKYDEETDIPTVLRFAPDYTIYVPFADMLPGEWYEPAVCYCVEAGYFIGVNTPANLFAPLNKMTMAQLCTVLARISGADVETPTMPWYANALKWALENEILTDIEFNAGANVTREVFIYMFYLTAARLEGYDMSVRADIKGASDYKDVSEKYRDAVSWAVASGIIKGTSSNVLTISPRVEVNRATVCQMLYNYYG